MNNFYNFYKINALNKMSKIPSSEPSYKNQKKIITTNKSMNNLPKVEKKIINRSNDKIITTIKNKKILISESSSNVPDKDNSIIQSNKVPYQKYHKVITYTPNIHRQPVVINETDKDKNIINKDINNITENNNIYKNVIYNSKEYNNNHYYVSKNQQKKGESKEGDSYSYLYDNKKIKKTIKYEYNSPEKSSKIFVKSIICSPISVSYTEIDRPVLKKSYNLYKEETEETEIMIKSKMRKIWENENICKPECSLTYIGDSSYNINKEYLIEEYEKKIEELNNTIYTLQTNKNTLEEQIEELKYNLNNNKKFFNMDLQSFFFNFIKDNKKTNESSNKILRKEFVKTLDIYKKINNTNKKPLLIQAIDKISFFGREKKENVIDYGTYLLILSEKTEKTDNKISNNTITFGEEVSLPGIEKSKNIKHNLKAFTILSKPKPKNIIQNIDNIGIIPDIKLKSKPKPKNRIEAINNIFIPPKEKKLFTWDTFYGQELYILAKKKKKNYTISFLDGVEILKTQRPKNIIEFTDTIEITPEPKAPLEINFTEEFYIPQSIKKLKSAPKPKNKIVYKDKIKLLGKNKEKMKIQKVSLVEIYSNIKQKIIEYEEKDYIFIPGIKKPENLIEEIVCIEILPEIKQTIELRNQKCDIINFFGLDKPKNEQQRLEGFDILRASKPMNIVEEQINSIFIDSTPKQWFLEIEFLDDIYIEREDKLKPDENKIVTLKGFDILKKPKELNEIEYKDELELLPEPKQKHFLELIYQNMEIFNIKGIEKPKNNIEKTNNINIFGKTKDNDLVIEFGDEIIVDKEDRPIYKKQRTQEVKILKKPKMKNIKQRTADFQLLKKFKFKSIKPKNRIQKKDNINIYPKDELFIEKILKQDNKIQRLNGFDILKQLKPQNEIQINEEIEIIPQPKKPLQLIYQKNDLFTIDKYRRKSNNNIYKCDGFEIVKKIKQKPINIYQKVSRFFVEGNEKYINNKKNNNISNNIIVKNENFQIISVSIRELYQQRLQGFMIYKLEKEPYEMEKNYNFLIEREYDDGLYGRRSVWDNLYIQNEKFNILSAPYKSMKNENQDDFIIEGYSKNSRYRDTFIENDSCTNSRNLSIDACKYCGGKKRFYDNYTTNSYTTNRRRINILKCKKENYQNNVNIVKSNVYKTVLALPQNEIDYINNIEISCKNKNDKLMYNSDDERIINRKRNNISTKIIEYKKGYNNLTNHRNSEMCNYNYSHLTDDFSSNENGNERCCRSNYSTRKRIIYKNEINNNDIFNNNCQQGASRYTFYRYFSNSGDSSNRMYPQQSKSQLKTIVINKNRKRKLFRFEEGKGVKIIYQ